MCVNDKVPSWHVRDNDAMQRGEISSRAYQIRRHSKARENHRLGQKEPPSRLVARLPCSAVTYLYQSILREMQRKVAYLFRNL